VDASLHIDGVQVARPSPSHRSKTDNDLFNLPAGIDGRSSTARRFKDVLRGFVAELGGQDKLDATRRLQVRNAAMLAVKVEQLTEASLTCNVDQLALVRQTNNLRRMLRDLGIAVSRPRRAAPDPLSYARKRRKA